MKIGEFIELYRAKNGLSQRQFANICGLSNGYVSMLESGKNPRTNEQIVPTLSTLKKISNVMGMSLQELMELVDDMPVDMTNENSELFDNELFRRLNLTPVSKKKIPLLGNVACGEPIYAEQSVEAFISVDENMEADFCLRAQGDSMINARIFDGDVLFVKKQDIVDDGDIALVIIEDEATVKRVYYDRENNVLQLIPENPKYKIIRYVGAELDRVRILGKIVAGQYKI